ncbi:hypothetical protein [Sessilibacter corallicola]|uniref:hypothetical protein n=1 Tax=Sessilibacter corallicola TaxID=2904075 RepID=UPI001E50730A|nr:hypothetical protein [Sessilibacter corallicola]MCE2029548.1 hypothetical protein [Sessilibacter corallicola]
MTTQESIPQPTLIRSTLFALVAAVVVLTVFVLPAKYNIDATGIGKKLGLTQLSTTNQTAASAKPSVKTTTGKDVKEIIIPANGGIEFKVVMQKHQQLTYQWVTPGEALYFDLHGEPEGDTTGYFLSYAVSIASDMKGSFIAPFDGTHGWYWKNTGNQAQLVQLVIEGEYSNLPQ